MEIVFNLPNPNRNLSTSDQFDPTAKTEKSNKICIDPVKSYIHWKGSKPGGEHTGIVRFSSGYIKLEEENVTGGSFAADMTSITDEDLRMKDMKEMLENHLKSADFFDVNNYPTATFEIHTVKLLPDDPVFVMEITGALTIKDIPQTVTFKVKQLSQINPISFTTNEVILNRTTWKINYNSKSIFKSITDKIIHDEFEISATIVLKE
ncbi:MAG: YceI family protein [Bacteroidales bacterium]